MTAAQQANWQYAIEHAPTQVLKMIDASMLTIWVLAEDRLRTASIALAKADSGSDNPLLVMGKDGQLVASPYIAIIARQSEIMIRAAAELGFTPSSRPRLASGGAKASSEDESPWAAIRQLKAANHAAV
jgi:P27 family predicted phage terminase small subunit